MSDKMRYGNLSSPNQWNVLELPSSHEHDYFPDIDEEPYEEDTDEDNAFIGNQGMTGSSNIPSPSIYIINYYNDINQEVEEEAIPDETTLAPSNIPVPSIEDDNNFGVMLEEEEDDKEPIHTNVGVLDEEEVADEEPSRDETFPGQSTISFPSDNVRNSEGNVDEDEPPIPVQRDTVEVANPMSDQRKTARQTKARKTAVPSNVKIAIRTLKVRKATIPSNGEKVTRSTKTRKSTLPSNAEKATSTRKSRKVKAPNRSSLTVSEADPFIGELVGFSCNSDIGKMLINEFDEKWVDGAICKVLDKVHGHIVGVVMRRSKVQQRTTKANVAYDIAWEHNNLGETSMSSSFLLHGCMAGARILQIRQADPTTSNCEENAASPSTASTSNLPSLQRKRKRGIHRKRHECLRTALSTVMEDEGLMAAPGSDSDEPTNAQLEETDEMSFEWLILGRDELGALHNIDAEETPVTIDGLLWEHGTKILHKPPDKTEHAPAEIYDQYKHMFNTPIDAMFAMLP
jgi:hypothetical protein